MFTRLLLSCLALSAPFFGEMNIVAISGSTRSDSYNKKLAKEAAQIARQMGAKVTVLDLKDYPMPFYDEDLESEQGMPESAKKFRRLLVQSDAVILSSPEYNGSISGVLKNALDWSSRGEQGGSSREAFLGKKFAIMSASPGGMGGARALNHLRAIIENVGGIVLESQVSVPSAHTAFSEKGLLANQDSLQQLQKEIRELVTKNE